MDLSSPSKGFSPYRELFNHRWTVESIQHHITLDTTPFKLILRKVHDDDHSGQSSTWIIKVHLTNNLAFAVVHLCSGFSSECVYIVCELEVTNGDLLWRTRDCVRNYHMHMPAMKFQKSIVTFQLKVFISTFCDNRLTAPSIRTPLSWSRSAMFPGHLLHELFFPVHTFEPRPFQVPHLSGEDFQIQFYEKLEDNKTIFVELLFPENIRLSACTVRITVLDYKGYPMFTSLRVPLRNGRPQSKKLKALLSYEDMYEGTQNFSRPYSVTLTIDSPFVCHFQETPRQTSRPTDFGLLSRAFAPLINEPEWGISLLLLVGPDEVPIRAPAALLMANSEVFRTMLGIDMQEKITNTVRLPDFEPEMWQALVKFFVHGASEETDEYALPLLAVAHCYQMKALEWYCGYQLCMQLTFENLHEIKQYAELFNIKMLKSECNAYLEYLCEEVKSKQNKTTPYRPNDSPSNPSKWSDVRLSFLQMKPLSASTELLRAEALRMVYENLFHTAFGSDVIFEVGDLHLAAHSFVLKARAPVLFEILERKESSSFHKVTINEDALTFKDFLLYIYTGRSELMVHNADIFLRLGWQYGIEAMRLEAEVHLMSVCVHSNASSLLRLASKYEANHLLDYIINEVQATTRTLNMWKKPKLNNHDYSFCSQ